MADTRTKPELNEIASAATNFNIYQGFLDQLANPDEVLRLECGGDITVYDNIGRDSRVGSGLRTRALAVVGKEWESIPYSDSGEDDAIATYVKNAFLGFPFDRARRALLRGGTLKGFALSEVMWDYSEGDIFIKDMIHRAQRRFAFTADGQILLKTINNPLGENVSIRNGLPLRKFQHVTFGDEVETPCGVGLGRELYWPWWFKKNGIKFWMMFCDKFSGPTVVGEYEGGNVTSLEDQNKLLSAAQAVHSNNAIIHPKGMSLRLMEAARSGNISTYRELAEFMNDEITICILGQTATTTGKPGAMGDANEQADVRSDLVKADADALCEALNSENGVVRWLVDYQFPGRKNKRAYPQIWIKCEDEEDELTVAERDAKRSEAIEKSGARLTPVYFKRRYSLADDEIETAPVPSTVQPVTGIPAFAENLEISPSRRIQNPDSTDASDWLAERLQQQAQPETDRWIAQLRGIVEQTIADGGDMDGMVARISELFGQMDAATLGGIIAQAMTLADAAARSAVSDEQQ